MQDSHNIEVFFNGVHVFQVDVFYFCFCVNTEEPEPEPLYIPDVPSPILCGVYAPEDPDTFWVSLVSLVDLAPLCFFFSFF